MRNQERTRDIPVVTVFGTKGETKAPTDPNTDTLFPPPNNTYLHFNWPALHAIYTFLFLFLFFSQTLCLKLFPKTKRNI